MDTVDTVGLVTLETGTENFGAPVPFVASPVRRLVLVPSRRTVTMVMVLMAATFHNGVKCKTGARVSIDQSTQAPCSTIPSGLSGRELAR